MLARAWRGRGLTMRVLILLSLALMPLGAISVWQTQRIAAQASRQAEVTLLAVTEHMVNPLQAVFHRAFGATRALAPAVLSTLDDPAACGDVLRRFVETSEGYAGAAFVPVDGAMRCAAGGQGLDPPRLSSAGGAATSAEARASITLRDGGGPDGEPVLVASDPVRDADGTLRGILSLSIPAREMRPGANLFPDRPTPLLTFNDRGEVLAAAGTDEAAATPGALLPAGRELRELAGGIDRSYSGEDAEGERRVFAVVAIVPGLAYGLSAWPEASIWAGTLDRLAVTGLMPILMWVASLLVAVLAFERLVFRHVRALGRQMRGFARTRRLIRQPLLVGAGAELASIEADFRDMAQSILQDEAALEDNLREKNILLKEVHHRVKNNLQLISSIMNMQARKLTSPEAREVLRRVQDRVMGLAAVHRSLYQTPDFGRIDAGAVVSDLARQIARNGGSRGDRAIGFKAEIDRVDLAPDEAVTLSLAVSEAMTNAVEQVCAMPDGAKAEPIHLTLRMVGPDRARLSVRNPRAQRSNDARPRSGLGMQLIHAFARQLDGTLEVDEAPDAFAMRLEFPTADRRDAPRDY